MAASVNLAARSDANDCAFCARPLHGACAVRAPSGATRLTAAHTRARQDGRLYNFWCET
ncbi:hypothetical protein [Faecalibaculum rodentium]|uniref:hypothetical protein n=1 Tax=Faecalibaculum rodentium TaxID=1702221 RepID=UPI0025B0134C|nr:hypothetical protein [Faecalibaculum rodentium]